VKGFDYVVSKTNKEQSSQSTEKVLLILEYLTQNRLPVRLQDVSDQLNIPQPTLLRYFNALIKDDYIYQDEDTKRYAMTWKVCKFGYLLRSNMGIRNVVGPYLSKLSNKLNLSACVVALEGYESVYVDLVEGFDGMSNNLLRIGKRAPLHSTGSGKVMLSTFSDYEFDKYVKEKGLIKLTENTITDKERLREELNKIKINRYAQDKEECEPSLQCISVPVYDYTNSVIVAISVFGHVSKTSDEYMKGEVLSELFRVSKEISHKFGCDKDIWEGFEAVVHIAG
jgi:DNA-binding IclR family transcriptional regulator